MDGGTQRFTTLMDRLRHAASQGHLDEVAECLQVGASLEPDEDGRTALHYAALNGYTDVTRFLLEKGCSINTQDASGYTALHRAASQGHVEVITALLERGCDMNTQDEHGNAAIHEAAWNGFSKTLELLVKYNVNVSVINKAGFTALHLSAQNGHNESSRVLLYAGCNSDIKNNYGDTALHTAARYGHAGVTRILISARAKLNEQNKNGDTALHIAAALKRRKIAKLLVDSGIDITVRNKQNETSVDVAKRKDHGEIIVIIQAYSKPLRPGAREVNFKADSHYLEGPEVVPDIELPGKSNPPAKEDKGKRFLFFKKRKPKEKEKSPLQRSIFPERRTPGGQRPPVQGFFSKYVPREGVQYYRDLAGNIKQGPVGYIPTCNCLPAIHRLQKQVHDTQDHVYGHIQSTNRVMQEQINQVDHRSSMRVQALEKYTHDRFLEEENLCRQRINQQLEEHDNYHTNQGDHVKSQIQNWLEQKLEGYGHCLHHHHDDSALPNDNIFSEVHETANGRLFKSRSDETLSQSDNHSGKFRKREFYESRQQAMQQIRAWQVPSYSRDRNRVKVIDKQSGNFNDQRKSQSRQQVNMDMDHIQRYPVEPRIEIRNQSRPDLHEKPTFPHTPLQAEVSSKTHGDYMDMAAGRQNLSSAPRQMSVPQPQVYPSNIKRNSDRRGPATHSTPKSKESSPYTTYSSLVRSQTDGGLNNQTDSALNRNISYTNYSHQGMDKTAEPAFENQLQMSFSERNVSGRSQHSASVNQTRSSDNAKLHTSVSVMSPTYRNSTSSDNFAHEVPKPTFSTFGYEEQDERKTEVKSKVDNHSDSQKHDLAEGPSSSTPRSNHSGNSDSCELAKKPLFSPSLVSRQSSQGSYGFTPRNTAVQDDMYVEMKSFNPRLHERAKSSEGLLETDIDHVYSSRSHSEERTLDSSGAVQPHSLSETRDRMYSSPLNSPNTKAASQSQAKMTQMQPSAASPNRSSSPYVSHSGSSSVRPPTLPKPSVHPSTRQYSTVQEVKRGSDVRYSGDSVHRNPNTNKTLENPYSTVKGVRDSNHNITVQADVYKPFCQQNYMGKVSHSNSVSDQMEPRSKTAYQTYLTENPHFSNENLYHRENSPNICNNSKEDSSSNPDSGYSSKIYGNRGTAVAPASCGSTPSSSFSTDRGISSQTNSPHSQYSNGDYEYLPKQECSDEVQNHVQTWYQRKLQETTQKVYDSWRSERSPGKIMLQQQQQGSGSQRLPVRTYGNSDYAKIDFTSKNSRQQQNGGQTSVSYAHSSQPTHLVSTFVIHGSDV